MIEVGYIEAAATAYGLLSAGSLYGYWAAGSEWKEAVIGTFLWPVLVTLSPIGYFRGKSR